MADEIDVLERREEAIRLRHEGLSYRDIARKLNVSVSIIQEDFRAIRNEWLRRIARNRAAWMTEILSDVLSVRKMAIEGYKQSANPQKENSGETGGKTSENATPKRRWRKKTRNYDPRFLAIAQEADRQRAAILGIGDKAAVENIDQTLGKKRPKLLVVRDREQAGQLVDVSRLLELEFAKPEAAQEDTVDGTVLDDGGQPVSDAAAGDEPQDAI